MLWLILRCCIIIAEFNAVKYLVVSGMNVGDTAFSILNLFDITYIQNKGAAFSLLSWKTLAFEHYFGLYSAFVR